MQEQRDKAQLNNPGSEEAMARFGGKDAGLPFFAFVDANGETIVNSLRAVAGKPQPQNIGHPYEPEEVDWFLTMVKRAAPGISPDESKVLEDWLRAQKKKTSAPGASPHAL